MPFYDYKCDDCDTVFEIEKSINDITKPICPKCESRFNKRIFNAVQLKGQSSRACSTCTDGVCTTYSSKR